MLFWDDGNSHGEGENQRGMTVGNNLLKQNSWKKALQFRNWSHGTNPRNEDVEA